jgi:RNA polymerase sigma factor (sigma-70 family)
MISKQQFPADGQAALNRDEAVSSGYTETRVKNTAQGILGRQSATFEEIWRAHAKQILRVTQRITNNREDAEDALQDSFLRAYVYLPNFDGRSSIATWLTRIAINSALMILRKRAGTPQVSIDDGGSVALDAPSIHPVDPSPSPEAQYTELEQQEIVRSAVGTLRPSIRMPLQLQALEERSVKETAETMGLSITATKSRIHHAKTALRKALQQKLGQRSGGAKQLQLSPA